MNKLATRMLFIAISLSLIPFVPTASVYAPAAASESREALVGKELTAQGESFARRGDWEQAKRLFQEALVKDPSNEVANYDLGVALARLGDLSQARASVERAININRTYVPAYVELSWLLAKEGRLSQAEEAALSALRIEPSSGEARKNLEQIRARRANTLLATKPTEDPGNFNDAEPTKILTLQPSSNGESEATKVLLKRGATQYRQGNFELAKGLFEQAIAASPGSVKALCSLAAVLGTLGDYAGQEDMSRKALQLEAANVVALTNLAWAQARKGDYIQSLANYQKALARDAEFFEAQVGQGLVLALSGKMDAGKALLKELLRVNPNRAIAHLALGECHMKEGLLAAATASYTEAVRVSPSNMEAKARLAAALLEGKDFGRALNIYRELADKYPSEPEYCIGEALCLIGSAKEAEAVPMLKRLCQAKPDLASAHSVLAMALELEGDLEASTKEWRQALILNPNLPGGQETLERLAKTEGRLQ